MIQIYLLTHYYKHMEQEKIYLPDLLKELSTTDFAQLENNDLVHLALKTKAAKYVLEQRGNLEPMEMSLLNGFSFYVQQLDNEMQKRNICLIEANQLIEANLDLVEQILKSYSFDALLKLLNDCEEMESPALQKIKGLAEKEIVRRTAHCRGEA